MTNGKGFDFLCQNGKSARAWKLGEVTHKIMVCFGGYQKLNVFNGDDSG